MSTDDLPPAPRLPSREAAGRRREPRPRALTREAIVAAALDIVDREGLDAMTMRTVAHALGTGAASLYAHVSSKEDLLELVIERVIGEVDFRVEPDPERWQEQVKEGLRAIRAMFSRHGDLARASFARIPMGENALRGSEQMIAVLRAGGLPDQVIAYACDLLPMYTMATAYEESIYARETSSIEEMHEFVASMRAYFAGLPPDRFPNMVQLAGPLTAGDGDERFEFGLEVLVRGLAAMAH
ncbi:MAG: TetR/AcrR family transcriptional regulator [Solirubrobacteraceae bacterium]